MARPGLVGGQYQPLTHSQVQRIHEASLTILDGTGIWVANSTALALYERGGAHVDGARVRIPWQMVERALQSVPSFVLLAGRDSEQDVLLEDNRVYAGTGGSPAAVLDPGEDTVRPGTLKDLVDLARIADALEHCDFIVIPLHPTDVPEEDVAGCRFYACLTNSTKHVMGGVGSVAGARAVLRMATTIAGSLSALRERPFVSAITSWMVSPLRLDPVVTDVLIEWCQAGLPVALSAAPMAGSTSPVTLAGTLVQLNAEQLSGIVLTQLIRPGTPVLAGYIPGIASMQSGSYLAGAVEYGMMQASAAQVAHSYHVPIYCSAGMSDSKLPDIQAGYEKMATLLLAAMGGCDFIHHAIGMVTNMSSVSLEQSVIDNEMVGMVSRVLSGIEVTDESLGVETVERVGPGGHYLTDPHTLRFMRSEFFYPRVADRQDRAMWENAGGKDARRRAVALVGKLLQDHRAPSLPSDVDAAIRAQLPMLERYFPSCCEAAELSLDPGHPEGPS